MALLDEMCMREALKQAQLAYDNDEVPVGAIITYKDQIIAKAHNQVEMLKDPTAHAEILAITAAASALGSKWLHDCLMYVTLEPCSMCAGALVLARVNGIYIGASDPKTGACGSVLDVTQNSALNHQVQVQSGLLEPECAELVTSFFKSKRAVKKQATQISVESNNHNI
jgi:tRNA(adenine34) deaminase